MPSKTLTRSVSADSSSDGLILTCGAITGLLESCCLRHKGHRLSEECFCWSDMVLSDRSIKEELAKGRIVISPLDPDDIQPASVDLHLDGRVLVFANSRRPYIDVKESLEDLTQMVEIQEESPFILHPGEFVLGSTLENIELPDDLVARLEGKSSLGRIGLVIHSTAGFVDPGWKGHLTLELSNLARLPITLYKGMKIGQISYLRLTTPADRLYGSESLGSKYQGQTVPTASRFSQDFAAPGSQQAP